MNNNKSHPGKGVDMKLIRKKIKKHIAEIDIENFHLNDHNKRELMFTAKAFELTLDQLIEKAMKDFARFEDRIGGMCKHCYSPYD
jgi:hypothetical protein